MNHFPVDDVNVVISVFRLLLDLYKTLRPKKKQESRKKEEDAP